MQKSIALDQHVMKNSFMNFFCGLQADPQSLDPGCQTPHN